jgi:hypothetical protein
VPSLAAPSAATAGRACHARPDHDWPGRTA